MNVETKLTALNRDLAELLAVEPMKLDRGGARALADPLWVWGVLGGKEVGKSTLINALAGTQVVDGGDDIGEGTYQPAAYFCPEDGDALAGRFTELSEISIDYHPDAPSNMKGLVLVDLPDFDSLFTGHVEQVRRVAQVLDGIVWVTTPKKVGDLRAIREIQRVLKSRTNFVYVVNKMDWLLSQSDQPPLEELDRVSRALHAQINECGANGDSRRTFLITAKHRTPSAVIDEIEQARQSPPQADLSGAVDRVMNDFQELANLLTTAPTAEASAANKRANLSFQVRTQAIQLDDHYQPRPLLERLERNASADAVAEIVERAFPQVYCNGIVQRLNDDRSLFSEWSSALFRRRIAHWPLLGIIAWPLTLLGALREFLPGRSSTATLDDVLRCDGLSLQDRARGALAAASARLSAVSSRVEFKLPDADSLTGRFRADVRALADVHRSALIEPFMQRRPGFLGRGMRWVMPIAIVAWFPLVQPILATILPVMDGSLGFNIESARMLVNALSASNVLAGLSVSLFLLAGLTAVVFSVAARDARIAIDRLRSSAPELAAEPLTSSLTKMIQRPIEQWRSKLEAIVSDLERLKS